MIASTTDTSYRRQMEWRIGWRGYWLGLGGQWGLAGYCNLEAQQCSSKNCIQYIFTTHGFYCSDSECLMNEKINVLLYLPVIGPIRWSSPPWKIGDAGHAICVRTICVPFCASCRRRSSIMNNTRQLARGAPGPPEQNFRGSLYNNQPRNQDQRTQLPNSTFIPSQSSILVPFPQPPKCHRK